MPMAHGPILKPNTNGKSRREHKYEVVEIDCIAMVQGPNLILTTQGRNTDVLQIATLDLCHSAAIHRTPSF